VGSHQNRVEGKNPLSHPAGQPAFDAARDMVGLLGCEHILLVYFQLFIHQCPQVLLSQPEKVLDEGDPSSPSLYWYQALPQPRCKTLHLALLNLERFIQAHYSSFSRSLWIASSHLGMLTTLLHLMSIEKMCRRGQTQKNLHQNAFILLFYSTQLKFNLVYLWSRNGCLHFRGD